MPSNLTIAADSGLQPQRTALSWTRTATSMLINAVICVRSAYVYESRPLSVLAGALLTTSLLGFWFGSFRSRQLASDLRSKMEVPHLAVLALTTASLIAAAAGILAVVSRSAAHLEYKMACQALTCTGKHMVRSSPSTPLVFSKNSKEAREVE